MDDFYRSVLDAMISHMTDGVMAEDESGRIIVANAAFARICDVASPAELVGSSAHELRERSWRELVTDVEAYRRRTSELRQARQPSLQFELVLTDGRVFDRDYVPVPTPDGSVLHMWHYREVTHQRKVERRLRESSRRLRQLSAFVEAGREAERRDLARTLHDEFGQLMSSLRLEIGAAVTLIRDARVPALRPLVDRLQSAAGLTDVAVASLRTVATALRSPVLDHLGLVSALRWEASLFSKRTGIRCHVRSRRERFDLQEAQVTALYRIMLAALDNIARHAAAGTTWIYLARQRGVTIMDIRDNGRGITPEQVHNPTTMGLLAMRERAVAVGGEVRITGTRGRGTRVLVILPDAESDSESVAAPQRRRSALRKHG